MLDAGRPQEKYAVFEVDASISLRGVTIVNAGRVLAFDNMSRRVERIAVADSTFRQVYSPAHLTEPPQQPVDLIEFSNNTISDSTKGIFLPLRLIHHARVSGNSIDAVTDAAIRLGSDFDDSFGTQRDIDVRDNTVHDIGGESDANGIKILGVDALIINNRIENIRSDDDTDSEGIYTKGFGHVISGNVLVDAGRTQAQINVKSDATLVSHNVITTVEAATNGIRLEGSDITVAYNEITGGDADSIAISTKLVEGFDGYVIEFNSISDSAGIGMSVGGEGRIVIRDNTLTNLGGISAIELRATRANVLSAEIEGNVITHMPGEASRAIFIESREGHDVSQLRIASNKVSDADHAVRFERKRDSTITSVELSECDFDTRLEPIVNDHQVEQMTTSCS